MKKKINSVLVLIGVLSSISSQGAESNDNSQSNCTPRTIELFPAEHNGDPGEPLHYLTDKPISLAIENYELKPGEQVAKVKFRPDSAKILEQITDKFRDKRLAVIDDGRMLAAPQIKDKITGGEIQISVERSADLEALKKILTSKCT